MSWRFPKNIPISNIIRTRYGQEILTKFRSWESKQKKLSKTRLDLNFSTSCKAHKIVPNFLKFKLYKKCLHNTQMYREFQQTLLDNEIETKKKRLSELTTLCNEIKAAMQQRIPVVDFEALSFYTRGRTEKLERRTEEVHERKLQSMGARLRLSSCEPDKVVFNFSNYVLSEREKFLLSSV